MHWAKISLKLLYYVGTNRKMNYLINIILQAINYIMNQVNYGRWFMITVIDFWARYKNIKYLKKNRFWQKLVLRKDSCYFYFLIFQNIMTSTKKNSDPFKTKYLES